MEKNLNSKVEKMECETVPADLRREHAGMTAELAKFRAEHTGSASGTVIESKITTLIAEALGSETFEEALMSAVEARLNLQLDSNLQGYMEAKVVTIQEELRGMLTTMGEVTASELRNLQTEVSEVRSTATASHSGACPCVSGNCPCKCSREDANESRGIFDPWFGNSTSCREPSQGTTECYDLPNCHSRGPSWMRWNGRRRPTWRKRSTWWRRRRPTWRATRRRLAGRRSTWRRSPSWLWARAASHHVRGEAGRRENSQGIYVRVRWLY